MRYRVLMIDTDRISRRSIVQQLGQRGCVVHEAGGLVEANRALQEKVIDVVLLGLPALKDEGLVFIGMIKREHPDIQIILLIEPEQIGLSIRGMKLGAFDDLMVPVDVDVLMEKIRSAHEKPGTGRAAGGYPGVSDGGDVRLNPHKTRGGSVKGENDGKV